MVSGRQLSDELRDAVTTDSVGLFAIHAELSQKRLSPKLIRLIVRLGASAILEDLLVNHREQLLRIARLEDYLFFVCWAGSEKILLQLIPVFERVQPGICATALDEHGRPALFYVWLNTCVYTDRPV